MHRIDTPTAQADKFGPGKNGFTNGDPATGRRATDLNSDMWDAVQEEICTVVEKAGLPLNKDQHDQLYQAIVQIITTKIPDALLKKNNLSDLADKALARANLQLKTAAQKDAVTSQTDTTAGRVLTVGYGGLGGTAPRTAVAASDSYDNIPIGLPSGFWTHAVDGGPYAYTITLRQDGGGSMDDRHLIIPSSTTGKIAIRWDGGQTKSYQYFYTDKNKPTAGDVGALPLVGGTMSGIITTSNDGRGSFASQLNSKAPVYQEINTAATSEYWPIIKQKYIQGNSAWSIGVLVNAGRLQIYYSSPDGSADRNFSFQADGQLILSNYTNFDARYQAKGNYTPAGQAYTKAESDTRFQPKGSYTPAGQAYTKAESNARYVQDIRLGTEVSVPIPYNGRLPAGYVCVASTANQGDPGNIFGCPLQKNVNGTWYTVAKI